MSDSNASSPTDPQEPTPDDRLDTANLTGRQIGRYLIGRRLGSGGAAAVYQAYDQVQGRSVALKVLLPGADEITRGRFRQEARTAGTLRHPNIVATLQVGDAPADGVAYIAMELIEGESLARLLERRGQLLPEESCNLLTPIAQALAHAHRAGVIHRDVKPSNILLRPASPGAPGSVQLEALDHPVVPLLSDFGIARALDAPELTNVGRTIGTPAYMAPEQCAGSREVGAQADIYSLGAVLYRCLVGRAPFLGSTTQILHAHVYEPVTIPDDILASLPPRVVDVLRQTLAKEPQARYPSAADLASALTLAAGRPLPPVDENGEYLEATSTLTLASLSPVAPAPQQRTETVIVPPSGRGQPPRTAPPVRVPPPASPLPPGPVRRRDSSPWPRLLAGLAGIAALLLIGIVLISSGSLSPFARLSIGDGETGTRQPVVLRATSTGEPNAETLPDAPPSTALPGASSSTRPAQSGAVVAVTPTPSPTPSLTASPTPTPEPTPSPTQPAVIRPTATPRPPTATPTAEEGTALACQYVAVEALHDFWQEPEKRGALGCATDQGAQISFQVQPFQNGLMLRRDDIQVIYVRFAGNGQWEQHPDRWTPDLPPVALDPALAPPSPGLFQPEAGMGLLWAENSVLRGTLGWATAPATATSGVVQTFDGGLLIRDMEAEGQVIYEFLRALFRF